MENKTRTIEKSKSVSNQAESLINYDRYAYYIIKNDNSKGQPKHGKLIVDRIAFDSGKPLMEKFLDFFCKNFTEHMVH